MPIIDFNGRPLEVNEDGFLLRPEEWNDDMARFLARHAEGLEDLTEEHWSVIRFIREHFLAHQGAPMVRAVCKGTGLALRRIYDLFPSGPARGACKLAGLPKPDGCV